MLADQFDGALAFILGDIGLSVFANGHEPFILAGLVWIPGTPTNLVVMFLPEVTLVQNRWFGSAAFFSKVVPSMSSV